MKTPDTYSGLSTPDRQERLKRQCLRIHDVLVIGGGITGAGVALDAASRGLDVILVEKQDFAAGTSSRSTKLIHGGLRYLEQLDFRLVKEVARERKILYRNAPYLIHPSRLLLPFIKNGKYSWFKAAAGLWMYDLISGIKKEERHAMLSRTKILNKEPLLDQDKTTGGAEFTEYRTDDARLVIEVIKTAAEYGAACFNYAEVIEYLYQDGKIRGAVVQDKIRGGVYSLFAKTVVNATGPWVDEMVGKEKGAYRKRLHHTKGVHIVVPHERLPLKQAVYFDAPDDRMVFAIPRDNVTYIGTTDTDYYGALEDPPVEKNDVLYLLAAINRIFPGLNIGQGDIVSAWAGIRPLIHEEGKGPSAISRKDELFVSQSGLISIAGGKLTGYRKMAERVMDLAMQQLSKHDRMSFVPSKTARIKLSGSGSCEDEKAIQAFTASLVSKREKYSCNENGIQSLVGRYGINAELILNKSLEMKDPYKLLKAELWYGVNNEGVTSLTDFLIRRTGIVLYERKKLPGILPVMIAELSQLLQLDQASSREQLFIFEEEIKKYRPADG